jgi:hypothetical protein
VAQKIGELKGASAEPWANTSSEPTSTITMMMGASHHFLRMRRKSQNSPMSPRRFAMGLS